MVDTLPARAGEPAGATASDAGRTLIECLDLVRIFAGQGVEVQALQGLNLRVERGEMTALVGASGSGKSTLLAILSGLDRPTAGTARVAGHDLTAMGARERMLYRRRTVGFVLQQTARNLVPYLTAAENVSAVLAIGGAARRERPGRVSELLDAVGIPELGDRRPHQMSGGQQQRAAIATALANEPEILLADEPTGELDERSSEQIFEVMREVNRISGVTVLIVTHDPAVAGHVNRTVQMRDGRLATEVLRRVLTDESGREEHIAEEFAVLDRVGRMQLPREFIDRLGLRDLVRLELEADHIRVHPTGRAPEAPDPEPDAEPDAEPGADS